MFDAPLMRGRGLTLQRGKFRFQFRDSLVTHGQRLRHVGRVEFLRNKKRWQLCIPRRNLEQDHLLGPRPVALR